MLGWLQLCDNSRPHQQLIFRRKIKKLLHHTDIWTARSTNGRYKCRFAWLLHVTPVPARSRPASSSRRMSARSTRATTACPVHEAKIRAGEFIAEVETRIATIRAAAGRGLVADGAAGVRARGENGTSGTSASTKRTRAPPRNGKTCGLHWSTGWRSTPPTE